MNGPTFSLVVRIASCSCSLALEDGEVGLTAGDLTDVFAQGTGCRYAIGALGLVAAPSFIWGLAI